MALQERLQTLRKSKGLSVAELSQVSGVSIPYLHQIERESGVNPSGEVLRKLATGLGVTVADLLGAPVGIPEKSLTEAPPALKELARKRGRRLGLRQEDIEMLSHVHFRGRQPENIEDWELIFLFLKRLLG